MKRTRYLQLFLYLAVASLTSCQMEPILPLSSVEDYITAQAVSTKGVPLAAVPETFAVWGYVWEDGAAMGAPTWMCGEDFTKDGTLWRSARRHGNIPAGYLMRLWGMWPMDGAGVSGLPLAASSGVPSFSYVVPSDVAQQKDVIVAWGDTFDIQPASFPLVFRHALSCILFKTATADVPAVTVKDITVSGLVDEGDYTEGSGWSGLSGDASYTIETNQAIPDGGIDVRIGTDAQTMIVMPQTLGATAEVTVRYKYAGDADWRTSTTSLDGLELGMGYKTVVRLIFENLKGDLTINVTSEPWNAGPEFAAYAELQLGNVLYATGESIDLVADGFDFSAESQVFWRLDNTKDYTELEYIDGTWGLRVNYEHNEWDIVLSSITIGDGTYSISLSREPKRAPLTFTVTSPGTIYYQSGNGAYPIEYQVNEGVWTTWNASAPTSTTGSPLTLNAGDVVKFRGLREQYASDYHMITFKDDGVIRYDVSGNIMSMIDSVNYATRTDFTKVQVFRSFFENCYGIVHADELLMPATTLTNKCYQNMFKGCKNMISVPEELAAEELPACAYYAMFYGCSSLLKGPEIRATSFTGGSPCYEMFRGCTAMVECTSELPATEAVDKCYWGMFYGCSSLLNGPAIRLQNTAPGTGTNWDRGCCSHMFQDCKNMTSIPWTFDADVVEISSYACMFENCEKLVAGPESFSFSEAKSNAFDKMFHNCKAMVNGPELPNLTVVASRACWCMFDNCLSMITGPSELKPTTAAKECYKNMFRNCKKLIAGPEIRLQNTAEGCCQEMFNYCESMVTGAVAFTAETLAKDCYRSMFENCYKLTTRPDHLTATVAEGANCYFKMFYACRALPTAPEIDLEDLNGQNCVCALMFYGCTGMTTGPSELKPTAASNECYNEMFGNCTALTTGPTIRLQNTAYENPWNDMRGCCESMFGSCTSMTSIPWTFTAGDTAKERCYRNMFNRCSKLSSAAFTLGATTVLASAYEYMFNGCSKLEAGPQIMAETIGNYVCREMFNGCSSMVTGPTELKAVHSAFMCYYGMFMSCSSLVTGPTIRLQDTTDGADTPGGNINSGNAWKCGSCSYMFSGCTNMTSIPWTFTTDYAAVGCYSAMFQNCKKLTVGPASLPATTLGHDCYTHMFRGSGITVAPVLPATTCAEACYYCMFQDCNSLVSVPDLPATEAAPRCYYRMFFGCKALVDAPDMMLTNTAVMTGSLGCCEEMFRGCSKLETTPHSFTAVTVYPRAYKNMFVGCSKLVTVSFDLPATTLFDRAYDSMFYECTSLTRAPIIKAVSLRSLDPNTTEPDSPCYSMFYKCTSLTYVEVWSTDAPAAGCANWMFNVPAGGTFKRDPALTLPSGVNGIPSGWTVVDL